MFKHPAINAIAASAYIILVSFIMTNLGPDPRGVLAPILFLSMFTLSAAVMGYLFFLQPVLMYLDGKKKEAVLFLSQTIGFFALITGIVLLIAFMRAR